MNGEYMSLETAKRIKQLEKEIANLNNDETHLLELHKKDKERIDKAIRYVNLLEKALIERDVTIDYILLDSARQLLEENIEIPEITIKYLRGDKE